MQPQGTLYPKPRSPSSLLPILPLPAIQLPHPLEKTMTSGNEPKARKGIRLTSRDAQILEALYGVGYLTTHQICALFFMAGPQATMGAIKACERPMRLLYRADLVRRIEQPVKRGEGSKVFIYALSKKGADFLISEI